MKGVWVPPPSTGRGSVVEARLHDLERRLARADHVVFRTEWLLNTGGAPAGALEARIARARLLSHPELLTWCQEAGPRAAREGTRRRLELLRRQALDAQLESHPVVARLNARVERRILRFRPRWKDRRVSLAELWDLVSRENDPGLRRAGYYASEPLYASLEPLVRELLVARNERARELGFPSYPEARLSLEGLSVAALDAMTAPFVPLAAPVSRRWRDRAGTPAWYPWDTLHAQWQEMNRVAPAFSGAECLGAVRSGLRKWGFTPADLAFRLRKLDTPTAGLALSGDVPRDVGVLCNPRDGLVYYGVLFHEMGHGIHGRSVRGASPLVRRAGFAGFCESVGGMFEQITADANWLQSRPGISKDEARRLRAASYASLAFRMAELVGEVRAELRLYARPEADLGDTRRRFATATLGYDDHVPVSWVDPYHLSPGFHRMSYLLATCFTEQVTSAGLAAVGEDLWPNPRWGPWLKRTWLRAGERDDWLPKVLAVTGRPLGASAFVAAVRREMAEGAAS